MNDLPEVSVVVPIYKTPKVTLRKFVKSIKRLVYPRKKIQLIFVLVKTPLNLDLGIVSKIIKATKNKGYGNAANIGINSAVSEIVLLTNPDVEFFSKSLIELVLFIKQNPGFGVVVPLVYNKDREVSRNDMPGLSINKFLGKIGKVYPRDFKRIHHAKEIMWGSGACILFRKSTWRKVGKFDESYFMYWEDSDFCMKVLEKGYRNFLVPSSKVIHKSSGESVEKIYYVVRNGYYFINKNVNNFGKIFFNLRVFIVLLGKSLKVFFGGSGVNENKAFVQGTVDYYLGKRKRIYG